MGSRLDLHAQLVSILGRSAVYFQAPANVTMTYPCIRYERDDIDTRFANNKPYSQTKRYLVTCIDKDPDSLIPDKLAKLPMCRFSRHFVVDGLNHDIFELYF